MPCRNGTTSRRGSRKGNGDTDQARMRHRADEVAKTDMSRGLTPDMSQKDAPPRPRLSASDMSGGQAPKEPAAAPCRVAAVRPRPPVAWRALLPVAAGQLALLVALGNRYGYHRDELYFVQAAKHPAFGYDDQPPLTPLLGRASAAIFGDDPRGLRVVSAIAAALVVLLVSLIARELGAGRTGQLVVAVTAAVSGLLAVGHILSTTTFDFLAWVAIAWLVALILAGGDERLWLAVGLVAGVGLENKD